MASHTPNVYLTVPDERRAFGASVPNLNFFWHRLSSGGEKTWVYIPGTGDATTESELTASWTFQMVIETFSNITSVVSNTIIIDDDTEVTVTDKTYKQGIAYVSFEIPSSIIIKHIIEGSITNLSTIKVQYHTGVIDDGVSDQNYLGYATLSFNKSSTRNVLLHSTVYDIPGNKQYTYDFSYFYRIDTVPSVNNNPFTFIKSYDGKVVYRYVLPYRLPAEAQVGDTLPFFITYADNAVNLTYSTIKEIYDWYVICEDICTPSGSEVMRIMYPPYCLYKKDKSVFPSTKTGLVYNYVTSINQNISEYKTGQLKAVEFIETNDNNILLQKGARVWAKDFIETGISRSTWISNPPFLVIYDYRSIGISTTYSSDHSKITLSGTSTRPKAVAIPDISTGLPSGSSGYNLRSTLNISLKEKNFISAGGYFEFVLVTDGSEHTRLVESVTELKQLFDAKTFNLNTNIIIRIGIPKGIVLKDAVIYDPVILYNNNMEPGISYRKDYSIICNELKEV